jgi:opacity protein-like surface antigen
MKKLLLAAAVMVAAFSSGAVAQVPITNVTTNAFDFGANYGGGGAEPGWTNGANAGFGFGAWTITTQATAGNFIGNPSAGGISGMSTDSFGLYANAGNNPFVNASRGITNALSIGQTLSFQWGVNFNGGAKGFNLLSGATQIINLNLGGGSNNITVNGVSVLPDYGTISFYVGITRTDASTYTVFSTSSRTNGTLGGFSTTVSSSLAADNFTLYASGVSGGDSQQPYFNDFSVTAVPEPSTYALLALSGIAFGGYMIRRRRR